MFHYAYLVGFFCSLPCEQNITGCFLELPRISPPIINTTFLKIWNSGDTELSPSTCHHNFTQSGALLSSTVPLAVSVWSGSQQCALAGGPWCRPSGGHSLCCCTVLCTSNVHFHCTTLFSIAVCVQQFVHCTVLHCSAFQSMCCVEQSLPSAVQR